MRECQSGDRRMTNKGEGMAKREAGGVAKGEAGCTGHVHGPLWLRVRLESCALEGHVMTKEIDMGINRLEKIEEK